MLKKFNFIHIVLILALPIVLALINPNWLFNLSFSHDFIIMVDDYIYTGYQLAFPQYVGWLPSDTLYFIERLPIILPGYVLNQITSPLMAHIILHIVMYLIAVFTVYGILNKLANVRVALIVAVLFGQYPLIMRSLGWNYPDGLAMTCMALAVLWLTYAPESRWRGLYVSGAGAISMVMIVSHFFNIFYAPAIALYIIWLDKLYRQPLRLIRTGIFAVLGAGVLYGTLALVYYQLTGNILLRNALNTTSGFAQSLPYFLRYHFSGVPAYWHVFLLLVVVITVLFIIRRTRTLSAEMRRVIVAIIVLFISAYAVIAVWYLVGFLYLHISFYHANIIMTAFVMLGMVIYKPISDLSVRQYRLVMVVSLVAPLAMFVGLTYLSPHWDVLYPICFMGAMLLAGIIIIYRQPMTVALATIGLVMCASGLVGDSVLIKVYNPDRYHEQRIFEDATAIAQTINGRYPRLGMDNFRLWYDFNDPKVATFHAVASIYLWSTGRNARLDSMPDSTFFEAKQIILLSSRYNKDTLMQMASDIIENRGIITFIDELVVRDVYLVMVNVNLSLFSQGRLTYYFSQRQQQYVLAENGWHGYEQATDSFRWTAEPTARLVLDTSTAQFDPTQTYRLSFVVKGYLEDAVVNSLKLTLNGVPIDLIRSNNMYVGEVAGEYLNKPTLELIFQTDRMSNPLELGIQDGRKLGVALGQLIIDVMPTHD